MRSSSVWFKNKFWSGRGAGKKTGKPRVKRSGKIFEEEKKGKVKFVHQSCVSVSFIVGWFRGEENLLAFTVCWNCHCVVWCEGCKAKARKTL